MPRRSWVPAAPLRVRSKGASGDAQTAYKTAIWNVPAKGHSCLKPVRIQRTRATKPQTSGHPIRTGGTHKAPPPLRRWPCSIPCFSTVPANRRRGFCVARTSICNGSRISTLPWPRVRRKANPTHLPRLAKGPMPLSRCANLCHSAHLVWERHISANRRRKSMSIKRKLSEVLLPR